MNIAIITNGVNEYSNFANTSKDKIPIRWIITMKLLCIYLFVLSTVCLGSVNAQKININVKGAAFTEVTKSIQKQSGYTFSISNRYLAKAKPVTLNLTNTDIDQVLIELFRYQPFGYVVNGKIISVTDKPKQSAAPSKTLIEQSQEPIQGRVVDQQNKPVENATITVKGKPFKTSTDENGYFTILANEGDKLDVQILGYRSIEVSVALPLPIISLQQEQRAIEEAVAVAQTGIQALPKKRATGSFSQINNELINRTVSTGIMSRLADVVPGLIFNKGYGGTQGLVIRGHTSIDQNTSKPLIVVDNFAYEGDINNINPNDVENVTILKDAAASSIWGARAGNGVIVITTKQGRYQQKPTLTFSTNYTIGAKPDAFYQPLMSTSDFIDNEIRLFDAEVYKPGELNQRILNYPLTPLVGLLIKKRDNPALTPEIDATIAEWRNYDVRNDYERYLYRKLKNQQYALNLSGGSNRQRYILSLGFDKNLNSEVGNGLERVTINANNTYNFFQNRLELLIGIYYTHNTADNSFIGIPTYSNFSGTPGTTMYPYAQFADVDGNPLALVNNVRVDYAEAGTAKGLLDWNYRPLDEITNTDKTTKSVDYRLNAGLNRQRKY